MLDGAPGVLSARWVDALRGAAPAIEVSLSPAPGRALVGAVARAARLFDVAADPARVAELLGRDRALAPMLRARPGLRVPGAWDGFELAVRAVLGQQVSVAGARTAAAGLTERFGRPVANPADGLTHVFPDVATLAALDPEDLPMPRSRGRALVALCAALADGSLALDRGPDRDDVRARLLDIPGIGPWTADYIAIRALGHPDVFLPTDLGTRHALTGLGRDPHRAAELSDGWRPWRSYAQLHLWQTLTPTSKET
jgi:AraC family transcriptional regulator of adaptative response / DNA-3-methyladenine glycosylase II